jgi:hypothetical protein
MPPHRQRWSDSHKGGPSSRSPPTPTDIFAPTSGAHVRSHARAESKEAGQVPALRSLRWAAGKEKPETKVRGTCGASGCVRRSRARLVPIVPNFPPQNHSLIFYSC